MLARWKSIVYLCRNWYFQFIFYYVHDPFTIAGSSFGLSTVISLLARQATMKINYSIIPFDHTAMGLLSRHDLNVQLPLYQSGILPLNYETIKNDKIRFFSKQSTDPVSVVQMQVKFCQFVGPTGLEPITFSLWASCTTVVLRANELNSNMLQWQIQTMLQPKNTIRQKLKNAELCTSLVCNLPN